MFRCQCNTNFASTPTKFRAYNQCASHLQKWFRFPYGLGHWRDDSELHSLLRLLWTDQHGCVRHSADQLHRQSSLGRCVLPGERWCSYPTHGVGAHSRRVRDRVHTLDRPLATAGRCITPPHGEGERVISVEKGTIDHHSNESWRELVSVVPCDVIFLALSPSVHLRPPSRLRANRVGDRATAHAVSAWSRFDRYKRPYFTEMEWIWRLGANAKTRKFLDVKISYSRAMTTQRHFINVQSDYAAT